MKRLLSLVLALMLCTLSALSFAEEEVPAVTEEAPDVTEEVPAVTEEAPAVTEEVPAVTEEAPAVTDEVPAVTEAPPAATEDAPAATEDAPAATEEAPAATESEPAVSNAEAEPAAQSEDAAIIGGADEPTTIVLTEAASEAFFPVSKLAEDAIAAGRRVNYRLSVPEVSGINTGDSRADAALAELFKALGLDLGLQGDEMDMGLTISGKEVLTLGWTASGEDSYIHSNLLGGTIVMTEADLLPLVNRLLDMLAEIGMVDQDDVTSMKEYYAELLDVMMESYAQSAALTEDELRKLDYSELLTAGLKVLVDLEEIDELGLPHASDEAAYGVQLVIDNEEFAALVEASLRFMQDNPRLMDYLASQSTYPTEEARAKNWERFGNYYIHNGIYASEEEYKANTPTFAEALDTALAEAGQTKWLDGDFVTKVYLDAQGRIVYLTSTLPAFTETETVVETATDAAQIQGTTDVLNLAYIRQTLAEGVSHVINADVNGEGVTIDLLDRGETAVLRLSDTEGKTLLNVNLVTEGDTLKGDFATAEAGAPLVSGTFSLTFQGSKEKYLLGAMFNLKHAGEDGADPLELSVEFGADMVRSGVDFEGQVTLDVIINQVKVVIAMDIATADQELSIMAGQVVRPSELSDADFANWFVGVYNALISWANNALLTLPESVLTLLLGGGM